MPPDHDADEEEGAEAMEEGWVRERGGARGKGRRISKADAEASTSLKGPWKHFENIFKTSHTLRQPTFFMG